MYLMPIQAIGRLERKEKKLCFFGVPADCLFWKCKYMVILIMLINVFDCQKLLKQIIFIK